MTDYRIRAGSGADALEEAKMLLLPRILHSGLALLPHTAAEDACKQMEAKHDRSRSGIHLVAVSIAADAIVGLIFLTREAGFFSHVATVSIAVHDEWHGRGVGSALLGTAIDHAENWLGLKRLTLVVAQDNEPASALYKKYGFEEEGRLRGHFFRAGRFGDALTMARLAPELRTPPGNGVRQGGI